jgi:cation transport protein ChaC
VNDGLNREDFTEERLAGLVRELEADSLLHILDRESRDRSRRTILSCSPDDKDVWVFGYGSLMWNPAIHFEETTTALLRGYHRSFCLWTPIGRGSPERPGLMLAMRPRGSCRGRAWRIAAKNVESETEILWRREMLSGAYRPKWVNLATPARRIRAITFVVNPSHPRYGAHISLEETAGAIAIAEGRLGRSRDYLHNLVLHLDEMGVRDGPMHRLYRLVQRNAPI